MTPPNWLSALRLYLAFVVTANLIWEVLHLPLYTIWNEADRSAKLFAVLHCTGGDLLIAFSTLGFALLCFGCNAWPAKRFGAVAAVTVIGLLSSLLEPTAGLPVS